MLIYANGIGHVQSIVYESIILSIRFGPTAIRW